MSILPIIIFANFVFINFDYANSVYAIFANTNFVYANFVSANIISASLDIFICHFTESSMLPNYDFECQLVTVLLLSYCLPFSS